MLYEIKDHRAKTSCVFYKTPQSQDKTIKYGPLKTIVRYMVSSQFRSFWAYHSVGVNYLRHTTKSISYIDPKPITYMHIKQSQAHWYEFWLSKEYEIMLPTAKKPANKSLKT